LLRGGASRWTNGNEYSDFNDRSSLTKKDIANFTGFEISSEIENDTKTKNNGSRTAFVINNDELNEETMDGKIAQVIKFFSFTGS